MLLYSEFLIKPSSVKCNLDCEYCFYKDVSNNRSIKNYGFMSLSTLEAIIKKAYLETSKGVTFGFQGGEPLLVGIEFYHQFFDFINQYNINNINTNITIQTNGLLITDEWAILFRKHNVLIGISLDGNKQTHDLFRVDYQKEGSFNQVMYAINILRKHEVDFNILTVLNKYVARNIKEIYEFYKENRFNYIQFIEVLDKNMSQTGKDRFSLNNKDYSKLLKDLFNLYYDDFNNNRYISIRLFDIMIHKLMGNESLVPCFNKGGCQNQNVIEASGDVFSCDFYVTDKYLLGNVNTDSIENIINNAKSKQFITESVEVNKDCRSCKYFSLCRNGCKRYRINNKYVYCQALFNFYENNLPRLLKIVEKLKVKQYV